eukprot:1397914-Pyramimonas_sp.AAC.1
MSVRHLLTLCLLQQLFTDGVSVLVSFGATAKCDTVKTYKPLSQRGGRDVCTGNACLFNRNRLASRYAGKLKVDPTRWTTLRNRGLVLF